MLESPQSSTGLLDPETAMSLTGLEFVTRLAEGSLPKPPIFDVTPMRLHYWEEGIVEFRAQPAPGFVNPMGTTHGGWMMTLLDSAMALAAHTTMAKGEGYTSVDTSVRFLGAIPTDSDELRAIGRVQKRGRKIITLEGRIETIAPDSEAGKLFATGTSSCMVL